MPAEQLAEAAREVFGEDRVTVAPTSPTRIDQAAALAEAGEVFGDGLGSGAVLVTGSVVTVGEARDAAAGPVVSEPRGARRRDAACARRCSASRRSSSG